MSGRGEGSDNIIVMIIVMILAIGLSAVGIHTWASLAHTREVIRIACNSAHGSGEACLAAVEKNHRR